MLELLLTMMVALLPFQKTLCRFTAAIPFVFISIAHSFLFSQTTGLAYYGSALAGSILALGLVLAHSGRDRVVRLIALCCMLSAILNAVGYFLWLWYFPKEAYNWFFLTLYGFVVWTLMGGITRDPGTNTEHSGIGGFIDKITGLLFNLVERGDK